MRSGPAKGIRFAKSGEVLTDLDGEVITLHGKPMTVASAILLGLRKGCDHLSELRVAVDESFKARCYLLAKKYAKQFPPHLAARDIAVIRRACSAALNTEAYGRLVEMIDPGGLAELEDDSPTS